MQHLVTFDFHNTLATADPWFELEIRELPAAALARIDPEFVADHDDVIARYRRLREEVMHSGREVDAVEGVCRIARQLDLPVDEATIAQSVHDLMHEATRHAAPIPGAVDAVRQITSRGIPVGVVSSAVYHPFLEWTLESFGIRDDLAFIVTSASSGHYKSNPEIYRYAMNLVDANPAASVHIGDSPQWDVWGAQQAGMTAIWFDNGFTGTFVDRDHTSEPEATVTSLHEVAPWVLRHLGMTPR